MSRGEFQYECVHGGNRHGMVWCNMQGTTPGFVFCALRADAARRTGRTGAWPFRAVRRSVESREPGSL